MLIVLLAAFAVIGGCTTPDDIVDTGPATPTPAPAEVEQMGAIAAPTPGSSARMNTAAGPQSVKFVDPATYRIPTPTPAIAMTEQPNDLRVSEKMVEYAKATVDYPPGVLATEIYHIPFPYWELSISATSMDDHPWLSMEIYEKNDPNRAIQEIQFFQFERARAGGGSAGDSAADNGKSFTIRDGYGDFYIVARSGALKSLSLTIRIPEKYLV